MLQALREIHHVPVPDSPSSRQPLLASESQETLLPRSTTTTKGDYGSGSGAGVSNEDEAAVDASLEERASSPSELAPQTLETEMRSAEGKTLSNGSGGAGTKGGKGGKKGKKNLSIA